MRFRRNDIVYETLDGGGVRMRIERVLDGGTVALCRWVHGDSLPLNFRTDHNGLVLFWTRSLTKVTR